MSKWHITVEVEVDDAALAEHDGDGSPPPNDVLDWYTTDLLDALELGIAEMDHDECVQVEKIS